MRALVNEYFQSRRLSVKIIAICLTRNDADILPRTVRDAASWCDHIIIVNHDSSDDTERVARDLERECKGVIFFGTVSGAYSNGIRSLAYKRYSHLANSNDWWCRLDSDEIYFDDPRQFLSDVPRYYRSVAGIGLQFYFTQNDLELYKEKPENYLGGECVHSLKYFNCIVFFSYFMSCLVYLSNRSRTYYFQ